MELLATNVKRLRKKLGWSVEELATRSGLSHRGVSNVERMERWPQPDTVRRLANALSVHPSVLFADPERVQEPSAEEALEILRRAIIGKSDIPPELSDLTHRLKGLSADIRGDVLAQCHAILDGAEQLEQQRRKGSDPAPASKAKKPLKSTS